MKPVQVVQVVGAVPVPEPKICCCFKRRSCGPQGSCLRSCGIVTLVLCIAHFVATVQMASYWSSWSDDVVDNEEFREDFIDLCEDTSLRSFRDAGTSADVCKRASKRASKSFRRS